jgi:hypothetical protein
MMVRRTLAKKIAMVTSRKTRRPACPIIIFLRCLRSLGIFTEAGCLFVGEGRFTPEPRQR